MTGKRRIYSIKRQLVSSSREAALAAIQIYNNPLISFKTESFIVLMTIAWTYLCHAYFRAAGVDYRYSEKKGGRKRLVRVDGQPRLWDITRCLNEPSCPLDINTVNNLRFLIGLRNQIEHARAAELDTYLSGRYQACALNYNHYIRALFGDRFALESLLSFSIQFSEVSFQQAQAMAEIEERIPTAIKSFITQFDDSLSEDEYQSERYSYRVQFQRKLASKRGQADRVIEFVDTSSPQSLEVPKERWVQKEIERPKYRAREVIGRVRAAGFTGFSQHRHIQIWKANDAKNPAKGFGVEVTGMWCWYDKWVEWLIAHLQESAPETRGVA